jgi:electron transport complex protein RnfG
MAERNLPVSDVKRVLAIGGILFAICVASALSLSGVDALTRGPIDTNKARNEKKAVEEIVTGGIIGERTEISDQAVLGLIPVYSGEDRAKISLYVLRLKSTAGYGGELELMAAYKPSGEIVACKLLENKETPGLGKKAEDPAYMRKFIGRGGTEESPVPRTKKMLEEQQKDASQPAANEAYETKATDFMGLFLRWMFGSPGSGNVDSVTGATITFTAVSDALYAGSEYVKKLKPAEEVKAEPEANGDAQGHPGPGPDADRQQATTTQEDNEPAVGSESGGEE